MLLFGYFVFDIDVWNSQQAGFKVIMIASLGLLFFGGLFLIAGQILFDKSDEDSDEE